MASIPRIKGLSLVIITSGLIPLCSTPTQAQINPIQTVPGRVEAEDYKEGGEGIGYHDTTIGNSGNIYRSDDVDIETTYDAGGGYNVGWISAGEWLEYDIDVQESKDYRIYLRVASESASGSLHVELDGIDVAGAITFSGTGGWQNWVTITSPILQISHGTHRLRVVFDTGSYNLNYIEILVPGQNIPPLAYSSSINAVQDTSFFLQLSASDYDGPQPLSYSIVNQPSYGTLTGNPPSVTYTPNSGYLGSDSFTWRAFDGLDYSNIATVSITVTDTRILKEYYISPDGSDSNDGLSKNNPWGTFEHAFSALQPGDTLWLMDGVYHQSIYPRVRNGEINPEIDTSDYITYPLDHPLRTKYYIKIKALNDGKAIIDGDTNGDGTGDIIPVHIGPCNHAHYWCDPGTHIGKNFVLEGLVAKNSKHNVYLIQGNNIIIKRCSGYDANTDDNSTVFGITFERNNDITTADNPANILVEDSVAGGSGRKMFVAVGKNVNVVFRRVFAAWQEWRGADPIYNPGHWPWGDVIEIYHFGNQYEQADLSNYPNHLGNSIIENSVAYGMWPTYGFSLAPNPYGRTRHNKYLGLMAIGGGMKWDGSLMDWPCPNPDRPELNCAQLTSWPEHRAGFDLGIYSQPTFIKNGFQDLFAFGNASVGLAAGPWKEGSGDNHLSHSTFVNNGLDPRVWWSGNQIYRDDLSRFDTATNLYVEGNPNHNDKSKGARLRYRYVNGVLMDGTNGQPSQELWPWPMEDRIREEFNTHMAKYHSVNPELQDFSVTDTIVPLINTHTAVPVPPSIISGTPSPSPSPSPTSPTNTDLDDDSDTDWLDLSILITNFSHVFDSADFNLSGLVDIFDFNTLLQNL